MDQQEVSRETLVRLCAERENAADPAVVAGLDSQIRLHSELAGFQARLFAGVAEEIKALADEYVPKIEDFDKRAAKSAAAKA